MYTTLPAFDHLMCWDRGAPAPGLRNHVIAFSTVALTDQLTRLAATQMPGTLALTPQFERGVRGADADRQQRAIAAIVNHPNVGAALIVTHDRASANSLNGLFSSLAKPFAVVALMAENGVEAALHTMRSQLAALHESAANTPRRLMRPDELTVALECGGSDASSSVCANPAIGRFVDRLVAAGGTAIVSETAEFLGGEAVVRQQSQSPAIAERILQCMAREEALMMEYGEDYRGVNPTQENIEAGLTTLTEKTMGALCKIGRCSFTGCLEFADTPPSPGLFFMDTPFFSPTSLSGMALGGAQIALFAVGVFNPSGMPLFPVLKVCGNPATVKTWNSCIDVDVTGLIDGRCSLEQAADNISRMICCIGNGQLTATERQNEGQLILPRTLAAL